MGCWIHLRSTSVLLRKCLYCHSPATREYSLTDEVLDARLITNEIRRTRLSRFELRSRRVLLHRARGQTAGHISLARESRSRELRCDRGPRRLCLWRLPAHRRYRQVCVHHAASEGLRRGWWAGAGYLQRLSDPLRGRTAPRGAAAQCRIEVRLQTGASAGRELRHAIYSYLPG